MAFMMELLLQLPVRKCLIIWIPMIKSAKVENFFNEVISQIDKPLQQSFVEHFFACVSTPDRKLIYGVSDVEEIVSDDCIYAFEEALEMQSGLQDTVGEDIYAFASDENWDFPTTTVYMVARSVNDAIQIIRRANDTFLVKGVIGS